MAEEIRTVDITPSPAYWSQLKRACQESVESYQKTLTRLYALLELIQHGDTDTAVIEPFARELDDELDGDLSMEAVTNKIVQIQVSMAECQQAVAELTGYGY